MKSQRIASPSVTNVFPDEWREQHRTDISGPAHTLTLGGASNFTYQDLLKLEDRIDELTLLYHTIDYMKLRNLDLKEHIDIVEEMFYRRESLDG